MSLLSAHYLDAPEQTRRLITAALGPGLRLTTAPSSAPIDPGASHQILIAARPRAEHLACSGLSALIIPIGGVPEETQRLLLDFPALPVHRVLHTTAPAAEMAIALMFAAAKRLFESDRAMRRGVWEWEPPLLQLAGAPALVLGFGHLGQRVARACEGLGMTVTAMRREPVAARAGSVEICGPAEVDLHLAQSSVTFVCLPSTPKTRGFIDETRLALLRARSILINVGRADVISERALFHALSNRPDLTAGLDVWYDEPERTASSARPPSAHPFHQLPNVILSPHRAWRIDGAHAQRAAALIESLSCAASERPIPHRVDVRMGY